MGDDALTKTEEHVYKVGQRPQLIDLNKTLVNFEIEFECSSTAPNGRFQMCVVNDDDITDLDSLPYKDAIGSISGKIVADKNQQANYFIVLKSDTPCEIKIVQKIRHLSPRLVEPPIGPENEGGGVSTSHPAAQEGSHNPHHRPRAGVSGSGVYSHKKTTSWTRILLYVIVVIGVLFLLYYVYSRYVSKDTGSGSGSLVDDLNGFDGDD